MVTLTAEQSAACAAHWAKVRRGLDIEAAARRASAESRPGHHTIQRLRWAAIVLDIPDRRDLDALHLRKRIAPLDWGAVTRSASANMAYGRRL